MERITAALSKLGIAIHAHDEAKDHAEHAEKVDTKDGQIVAKTVLLKDKKGRAYIAIHHPNTIVSTKLLSTRLGCGKGGVAEASSALTREVFGSSSVITLGCVMDCTHAIGVLLDEELRSEFWVGAANRGAAGSLSGSIFLDGVHLSQLLQDRSLITIDFAANPRIDRDNPPDLKDFADGLEPLPQDLIDRAREQAEKEQSKSTKGKAKETKGSGEQKDTAVQKSVLDVNKLASDLIQQISAIPSGDAEAQRRIKLDVASQLNQLRNAAYAAGFAAKC